MSVEVKITELFPEGSIDELLWLDFETTGLDERRGRLLEIGMIKTDSRLRVLAEFEAVVNVPGVREFDLDPRVRAMHEGNGLFDAVEASRLSLIQVEDLAISWVLRHGCRGRWAAGLGIGFDRRWAREHMPRLEGLLDYRDYDLLTLRRFFRTEKVERPHRALPDLQANVRDMRAFVALRDRALQVA